MVHCSLDEPGAVALEREMQMEEDGGTREMEGDGGRWREMEGDGARLASHSSRSASISASSSALRARSFFHSYGFKV